MTLVAVAALYRVNVLPVGRRCFGILLLPPLLR
jgi:hypothetical protein